MGFKKSVNWYIYNIYTSYLWLKKQASSIKTVWIPECDGSKGKEIRAKLTSNSKNTVIFYITYKISDSY
jgi:hypothetical protein